MNTYVCIWIYVSTYIYIYMYIHMARVKLASGARLVESNFRKFECSCWCSSILFEKTKWKCVPQMGRIYVTQNDNKNDNKINPKAIFKHHGPLITLPWRFSPDEPITIRLPALIIEQIIDWIFFMQLSLNEQTGVYYRCGYMWLRWVCSKKRFCSKGMNARGQWKLNEWFFGWRPHVHKPLWLW